MRNLIFSLLLAFTFVACKDQSKEIDKETVLENSDSLYYNEQFRPQYHFSPEEKWMNDPNGMVHHKGIYHLFYQYYPEDIVWGPMHWGHATSKDLIHWEHKPIALYPDKHGLIFSGSAVVDKQNTSGFGTMENPAIVAIYTYHLMEGEKAGRKDFQTQGIAYSSDNGDTWAKYEGNPVIGNKGIKDFRDPKVMWHQPSENWIMTLVAGDHAQFYSSKNLKDWKKTGEFGKDKGAHGGVWECPDLFKLKVEGSDEEKWVLLISMNPGAPNGGSGTQYFIGDFDGKTFTSDQTEIKWIDWGTDNYAGVTYSNEPNNDRIFIGWMSNWTYARDTPTEKWRSAMTLPRKLELKKFGGSFALTSYPVKQFENIIDDGDSQDFKLNSMEVKSIPGHLFDQTEVRFKSKLGFQLEFMNNENESLLIAYSSKTVQFIIDRMKSGQMDFEPQFASRQEMPTNDLPVEEVEFRLLFDKSSIEIFINKGQYVMTSQLFPSSPYNKLKVLNKTISEIEISDFQINRIKRIW